MQCPSPECGSSNIQLLSLYVDGLHPGAPNRGKYARPAAADGKALPAVGLIVLGIVLVAGGGIGAGAAAVILGGLWGYGVYRMAEEADRKRAAWENARICLACTERWTP